MKRAWILIVIALLIAFLFVADSFLWFFGWGFSRVQSLVFLVEDEREEDESLISLFLPENINRIFFQEAATVDNPRKDSSDFQAGVAVLTYGNEWLFGAKTRRTLNTLIALGANSVSLGFPLFQEKWTSSEVKIDEEMTLSEKNIRTFIREARRRGFTVTIRPILDEETLYLDDKWRGTIKPNDIGDWFESYSDIMLRYAKICQEEGVEIFSIGVELSSLEGETEEWEKLISSIKEIYDGQLTYSVNWHNAFDDDIQFWSELDFIGIDAFFRLNVSREATVEELVEAWRPWISKIEELKSLHQKPVVFTESGVVSQAGSFRYPWRPEQETELDLNAQYIYYLATCQASSGVTEGIYWWYIDLNVPQNPEEDTGFSPLRKPAEEVIKDCFREIYLEK